VIGGKYFQQPAGEHPKSQYKEDLPMTVRRAATGSGHPVIRGVVPLALEDEAYRGMWLSPRATVLMETDCPENDRAVVYVGPYEKARVIYIQMGHGESTMRHPGYRRLVHNALLWTASRD
jgi:type 1 glutamine amidotransferase